MQQDRRNFLKFTGAVGTGLVLNSLGSSSLFAAESAKPLTHFGIQLYTLRDVIPGIRKGC